MNIFLTDPDPKKSAIALDNLRLNKMVLETAQLLASACVSIGEDLGYKATHYFHPCAVWTRHTKGNYSWLVEHGLELAAEFEKRFYHVHASEEIIKKAHSYRDNFHDKAVVFDFNCSGFNSGDVFEDYKNCLRSKWASDTRSPQWYGRPCPEWRNL